MSNNKGFMPQRHVLIDPDTDPGMETLGEQKSELAKPASARLPLWPVLAVVMCLILPLFLVCIVAVERNGFVSRLHYELRAMHETLGIVHRIDQELARLIAIGQTLATSPRISAVDLDAFRQQAVQVSGLNHIGITLNEPGGTLLVDTLSQGDALSTFDDTAIVLQLLKAKRPLVMAPVQAHGQSAQAFKVVFPIFAPGAHDLTHLLALHVPVSRLQPLLDATETIGAIASLIDDRGQIIANATAQRGLGSRSDKIISFERTVGEWSLWPTKDVAGEPLFLSYGRSALTGWLVRLDIRGSVLRRHHNRFTRDFLILAMFLLLVSLSVCIWAIRRFQR